MKPNQTPIETMKMIALPNGSFVRSDAVTAVSVVPEHGSEEYNYHFPNRVFVYHAGGAESITVESLDQAKELAAEISRQCTIQYATVSEGNEASV